MTIELNAAVGAVNSIRGTRSFDPLDGRRSRA
jgi:hypothetical protein